MTVGFDQKKLKKLDSKIKELKCKKLRAESKDRQLSDYYRKVLRLYQDKIHYQLLVKNQISVKPVKLLENLARDAMLYLGGECDPRSCSLKDYDHEKYGPYLGISDEGSAAHIIRQAALASPKMKVIGKYEPLKVGVAHDAERLGAIGEVPVGPEEYVDIRLKCVNRILTSTNVGTRLNLRFYKRYPVVVIYNGPIRKVLSIAKQELKKTFEPFLKTPNKKPRPLMVFIEFDRESRRSFKTRVFILRELNRYVKKGVIADPKVHELGFQISIGFGYKGRNAALFAIDMAKAARINEIAIDGVVRREAEEKLSLPGLLNYLAPGLVGPVLRKAKRNEVIVHPKNTVDVDTVARNVWCALNSARHMGLDLGKYGTFPLTLEESDEVIAKVQSWFKNWTAAPVFFVDQGIISNERVYIGNDIVAGLKEWLKIIKKHRVPVVLIDTVDKSKGWRILRTGNDPKGLLGPLQIRKIDRFAAKYGIKVLWAGGISLAQTYEFGKMGVFGIYVTSATASKGPVTEEYERDPLLASLKEPTIQGASRAKLLLEAGFLVSKLNGSQPAIKLDKLANSLIKIFTQNRYEQEIQRAQHKLFDETVKGWRIYLKSLK